MPNNPNNERRGRWQGFDLGGAGGAGGRSRWWLPLVYLAALTSLTSDFSEAVRLSSEILLTRGHIYPATTSNIELEVLMEDGTRVRLQESKS